MTKGKPSNLAASVHARLINLAAAQGRRFNDLLQLYAMERLLYRLSKSPHASKFLLKGALLLRVWDPVPARNGYRREARRHRHTRHEQQPDEGLFRPVDARSHDDVQA